MAGILTSIRLDTFLADEAVKVLGVKSRTEAVDLALREIVAMKRSGVCPPRMVAAKDRPLTNQRKKM